MVLTLNVGLPNKHDSELVGRMHTDLELLCLVEDSGLRYRLTGSLWSSSDREATQAILCGAVYPGITD